VSDPIRIVLAEDHELVRAGLKRLIADLPGLEVVGEAAGGREALALVGRLMPDVIVLDVSMPELGGLHVVARIAAEHPGTRVLMLSMHDSEEYVWQALRAGAAGYVLKDASPLELELAIRAVARGGSYLSPAVSRHVVRDYVRGAATARGSADRLTRRQTEIIQLIAGGSTNAEIARSLGVSVKTVESHRSELMDRLGIHDVAGLVRYAVRVGLVSSD
jgi:DNA-binding NarL/FixJ family response regulator